MSYCEVITFKDGKPDESLMCRNAWGGAAYIWTALFDKYLKDPMKEYDSWLTGMAFGRDDRRLWNLADRKDLPRFMRAVHAATFDRATVSREHLKQFAADLREFVRFFGTGGGVCHLQDWADWIDTLDVEAIGFYGTSVSENLWFISDDEESEDDERRPYDLNKDEMHFEVYAWLEAVDAETAGVA